MTVDASDKITFDNVTDGGSNDAIIKQGAGMLGFGGSNTNFAGAIGVAQGDVDVEGTVASTVTVNVGADPFG